MIKPSNCVPQVKDIKIQKWWDLSAGLILAGGTGALFTDPFTDYEVVGVHFLTTVTLSGTATSVVVGIIATTNKFVASVNVVAVVGNRVVGVQQSLTIAAAAKLAAGTGLVAISTGTADTGEGLLTITLRPMDKKYASTKRPSGADAVT